MRANTSGGAAGRPLLEDGDGQACETVDSVVGGWRPDLVRFWIGGRQRRSGPCARAQQSLVPWSTMGSGLGHQLSLGLESVPRLARPGAGRLGTLGTPAAVGAARSAAASVGASGPPDVEPDHRCVGLLQQWNMDAGLADLLGRHDAVAGCPSRRVRGTGL